MWKLPMIALNALTRAARRRGNNALTGNHQPIKSGKHIMLNRASLSVRFLKHKIEKERSSAAQMIVNQLKSGTSHQMRKE